MLLLFTSIVEDQGKSRRGEKNQSCTFVMLSLESLLDILMVMFIIQLDINVEFRI